MGDGYTQGDIFDGINFRGAQLASDDNMLPDSQRGFAPVIHGIARGTAQVTIKQNGYDIYNSTVPPGPFTINDIYAAGNSGDLQVTIKEADGSTQIFTVPYSSVPLLQREGHTRYSITAGEYRSGNAQQEKTRFFQSTLLHGLPAGWTIYGGTQLADRYRAFNFGIGKNMGALGALSVDMTQANSTLPDDSQHDGQSVRFLYNKSLNESGTNIQLVGYRYSTSGYFNFADTTYSRMNGYNIETQDGVIQVKPKFTDYYNLAYNKRGKLQLTVTQQLGRTSTLYLSGSHQTYWGTSNVDEQFQAGLNTAFEDINWTLSYSLTKNAWQKGRDQMLALNVNIPYLTPVSSAGGVAIKAGSLIAVLILRQTNNYNSDDFQFVWNIYANNDVVVPTGGCDVSARDVTVTLPDYPGSVPIPLTVYCAKSQNLGYYLSGTTVDAGNSIFTNTASFSPAQGVGVQLTRNGTIIPANNTVSLGAVGTSAVSLGLTANYARTGGQVTAGNVQSIIGVTFVYQ